jgi:DNA-binding NarL/FixJ family response regulator
MTQQTKIRLLIADDHEIVRSGLKSMLANSEIKVVGEVASGQAAIKFALEKEVDVVLLDIRMPDGDGWNALGRIKLEKPGLPVLMLSNFDNPAYIARTVALEASGYLLKGCTRDQLIAAIETVATGETTWTREELRQVSRALATPRITGDVEVPLTQRESEVMRQVAYGLTNNQIAKALDITTDKVKEHVRHILGKVGVTDRTQAAVWAVHHELV